MKKRYILLSVLLFLFACAGEKEKIDKAMKNKPLKIALKHIC
jgi:hypothetical protein